MRALHRAGGERILALGYNRRFAPMMVRAREHMAGAGFVGATLAAPQA